LKCLKPAALESCTKEFISNIELLDNLNDIGIDDSLIMLFGDDLPVLKTKNVKQVTVALENVITDAVKKLWEWVKDILEKFKRFIKKIFNVGNIRSNKLKKKLKEKQTTIKKDPTTIKKDPTVKSKWKDPDRKVYDINSKEFIAAIKYMSNINVSEKLLLDWKTTGTVGNNFIRDVDLFIDNIDKIKKVPCSKITNNPSNLNFINKLTNITNIVDLKLKDISKIDSSVIDKIEINSLSEIRKLKDVKEIDNYSKEFSKLTYTLRAEQYLYLKIFSIQNSVFKIVNNF